MQNVTVVCLISLSWAKNCFSVHSRFVILLHIQCSIWSVHSTHGPRWNLWNSFRRRVCLRLSRQVCAFYIHPLLLLVSYILEFLIPDLYFHSRELVICQRHSQDSRVPREWRKVFWCQRHWLRHFSQLVVPTGLRAKKHHKDVQREHSDRVKTCRDDEKTLKLRKHSSYNCYHNVSITVHNVGLRISVEVGLLYFADCPCFSRRKCCHVPSALNYIYCTINTLATMKLSYSQTHTRLTENRTYYVHIWSAVISPNSVRPLGIRHIA